MSINISDVIKNIQKAEASAETARTATEKKIAEIEKDTAEKITKLNDEAKKAIDAKVNAKLKTSEKASVKSAGSVEVDKKKRDVASKYVLDSFWSFIK